MSFTSLSVKRGTLLAYRRAKAKTLARKYRGYTMLPSAVYVDTLMLVADHQTPGSVVECGVWRGGMIAGIAEVLGPQRAYYLLDSFEGLPPAQVEDGPAASEYQANPADPAYHDNCAAEQRWAEQAMARSGATQVTLLKGWFEQTVPTLQPRDPIAVLRVDGDWYHSTKICLDCLYPLVVPGGLILLDDYYTWDGCTRAVHEYLAAHAPTDRIRQTPAGAAYLLKGSGQRSSVHS